jgi:hypothetical protein
MVGMQVAVGDGRDVRDGDADLRQGVADPSLDRVVPRLEISLPNPSPVSNRKIPPR